MVETITYGGIVTRILAPDRAGRVADVVLGFNDLGSYVAGSPYFGAIAGRVAGRISRAKFELDGRTYKLFANDPPNHLHGGMHGFDKKIWSATPIDNGHGAVSLRLKYRSLDGEEGYPGTVDAAVTYTVTADNKFVIESLASTDRPTPFALTHHSYFNLGGEGAGTIDNHELQIEADEVVAVDEHMTLLGRLEAVTKGGNDFRQPRCLGEAIPLLFQSHGDLYYIRKGSAGVGKSKPLTVARLAHPDSGRVLELFTTESYFQLYTGSALDGTLTGKSGVPYARHAGVCLECEGYPDGANVPELGDIILRPESGQQQTTVYAFSVVA